MTRGLELLPNLQVISVTGRTWVGSFISQIYPVVGTLPEAYNRRRSWQQVYCDEDLETNRYPGASRDHFCDVAHLGVYPRVTVSPRTVLEALGDLDVQLWATGLELNLEAIPLTAFDGKFAEFATRDSAVIDRALKHIRIINFREGISRGRVSDVPQEQQHSDSKCIERWERFMNHVNPVKHLAIEGDPEDHSSASLFATSIQTHSYQGLETVSIRSNVCHDSDERALLRPMCYTSQELDSFLPRHGKTLKHLKLLHVMRYNLPHLETAVVLEELHTREYSHSGSVKDHRHMSSHSRNRTRENSSRLGRLARECGIAAVECECWPDKGDVNDPNDERPPLDPQVTRALYFQYDFGPYVLRDESRY